MVGIEADIQGTDFGHRRDNDLFGFNSFGGFGTNNGIFTAATVPDGTPGIGIRAPTLIPSP